MGILTSTQDSCFHIPLHSSGDISRNTQRHTEGGPLKDTERNRNLERGKWTSSTYCTWKLPTTDKWGMHETPQTPNNKPLIISLISIIWRVELPLPPPRSPSVNSTDALEGWARHVRVQTSAQLNPCFSTTSSNRTPFPFHNFSEAQCHSLPGEQ